MLTFIRCRFTFAALVVICFALPVSAQAPKLEKVVVTLTRHNAYFVNGRRVKENQIGPLLAARARKNPEIVAVLRCDSSTLYGRVVELRELVTAAGVKEIMFAAPAAVGMPHRRRSAGHFRGTRA